jgi:hypothetical protein
MPTALAALAASLLVPAAWAEPPAQPAPPKKPRAQGPAARLDGLPVVESPIFSRLDDGSTRVSVEVGSMVAITELQAEGRLVYRLQGARIAATTSRMPIVTAFFPTPVARAGLVQVERDVDLVIEFQQTTPVTHRVLETPRGIVLQIDFPKIAGATAVAPQGDSSADRARRRNGPKMSGETHNLNDGPSAAELPPEDPRPEDPAKLRRERDGARFRGGVALQGGAILAPGTLTAGVVGLQTQLGAQINHGWGIYLVPSADFVVGPVQGLNLSAAILVDWTWDDTLSVGLGPDAGVFAALGSTSNSISAAGGILYGGRLHFAWYPVIGRGDDGIRRKALALGVDVRLLGGGAGFASSAGSASATRFVASPLATIGYQAF